MLRHPRWLPAAWAMRSLGHHRTRTLLTATAIALPTALLVSTLGFQTGFERSLRRSVDQLGYQVLVTGRGCPHEAATLILRGGQIPMYIEDLMYQEIVSDPDVKDATRFLMQSAPSPDSEQARQLCIGIDDRFLALRPGVSLDEGEWFSSDRAEEAILGHGVADYRRLAPGDTIEVTGRRLAVRGVLSQTGTQDDGTIFLPLATAQSLFDQTGRLTGIGIQLRDLERAPEFMEHLYQTPSISVVRLAQVQSTILRVFRSIRDMLAAFGTVCLVVALLGVLNVALISVNERWPEMGVLRAVGCSAGRLFQLVWSESLVLGILGSALGVALTLAVRGTLEEVLRRQLPLAPKGALIALSPGTVLWSCGAMTLLCLVAAAYPAFKATRVAPVTALQGAATWP